MSEHLVILSRTYRGKKAGQFAFASRYISAERRSPTLFIPFLHGLNVTRKLNIQTGQLEVILPFFFRE
ncbi:MAG: hypothetical protein CMP28_09630 [Roseibacillus sp.]|nr:hypothetical protein [Roseibacillus sp.]